MPDCLIAIGSNEGDCQEHIRRATRQIDELPETRLLSVSTLLETAPVGSPDQRFLNGALLIETSLEPLQLMRHLLQIETRGGRDRHRDSGNRPIDLDILLWGQQAITHEALNVPHPRMTFRRFVMQPATEIAAGMPHPVLKRTLGELLQHIDRQPRIVTVLLPEETLPEILNPAITRMEQERKRKTENSPTPQWELSNVVSAQRTAVANQVADPDQWLIVVSNQLDTPRNLNGGFQLLIRVVAAATEPASGVTSIEFPGPQWTIEESGPDKLVQSVLTSIQALQPIHSSKIG